MHAGFLDAGDECSQCGDPVGERDSLYYDSSSPEGFVCGKCRGGADLELSPGVRRYLRSAAQRFPFPVPLRSV